MWRTRRKHLSFGESHSKSYACLWINREEKQSGKQRRSAVCVRPQHLAQRNRKALKQRTEMNLLAKCKHRRERSYSTITAVFVLKANVINGCNFHDNSWHRSTMCSWAKPAKKRVAAHVSCCLKLRSLIWLAQEKYQKGKKKQHHKPSVGAH